MATCIPEANEIRTQIKYNTKRYSTTNERVLKGLYTKGTSYYSTNPHVYLLFQYLRFSRLRRLVTRIVLSGTVRKAWRYSTSRTKLSHTDNVAM